MNRIKQSWPMVFVVGLLVGFVMLWWQSERSPAALEPPAPDPAPEPDQVDATVALRRAAVALAEHKSFEDYQAALKAARQQLLPLRGRRDAKPLFAQYRNLVIWGSHWHEEFHLRPLGPLEAEPPWDDISAPVKASVLKNYLR